MKSKNDCLSNCFFLYLGKPEKVPEPSIFTFLSSSSGPTMNFHTINITTNDTGLHAIIRPASPYDVYYVYLKYEGFPNETYYDWKGEVRFVNS